MKIDRSLIEQGSEFECYITNSVSPVNVVVRKLWMDEHPEYQIPMFAQAEFQCQGQAELDEGLPLSGGYLWFEGEDTYESFVVLPHWNGNTECTVTELIEDRSVESDDSDCEGIAVLLGHDTDPGAGDYDCTILNTRLYQGIPALGPNGLVLLALLLFGLGAIGIRRLA